MKSAGTTASAAAMAKSEEVTIIGGGNSVAAVKQAGLAEKVNLAPSSAGSR